MEIKTLFEVYKTLITNQENSEKFFKDSGMLNISEKLDFGFFPLGSGILNLKSEIARAEIEDNSVMILGNDFGTYTYLSEKCKNNRESETNKTIQNLKNLKLNLSQTFFTNFYLGVRNDIEIIGTTNTNKIVNYSNEYIQICLNFFQVQLELINPSTVVCMGKEVGKILSENFKELSDFNLKNSNFIELYKENKFVKEIENDSLGKRKFILIPHPSYSHINWTDEIIGKINNEINA